jgi:ligand-binding SRPBCC domain-containing protein
MISSGKGRPRVLAFILRQTCKQLFAQSTIQRDGWVNGRQRSDTIESMTQRFETRQWVSFPIELVFAFFANPSNLPHLMPPALQSRIEDVRMQPPPPRPLAADPARRFRSIAAGTGSEILISFRPVRWIPQRLSWMARIAEFEWNSHFIDEQVQGPFKRFRHRHGVASETRDNSDGTMVTDSIEFELPGGAVGSVASGVVRGQLKKAFTYRQQRLLEILAIASRQAAQRA